MTLIDSNILIDLFADDITWYDWSRARFEEASLRGPLFINEIVYAETSIGFESIERLDAALARIRIEILSAPPAARFLAGKAFLQYRRGGGGRTGVLPDFFIGAHAAVSGLPLLTRDGRRYRSYFPSVTLISPE